MSARPWEQLPLAGRQRGAGQLWEPTNMCVGVAQHDACLCRATGKVNIVKDPFSASEEKKLGVVLLSPRSQAAKLPAHYLSGALLCESSVHSPLTPGCTASCICTTCQKGFCFALATLLQISLRQPCSPNAACQSMQTCSYLPQNTAGTASSLRRLDSRRSETGMSRAASIQFSETGTVRFSETVDGSNASSQLGDSNAPDGAQLRSILQRSASRKVTLGGQSPAAAAAVAAGRRRARSGRRR